MCLHSGVTEGDWERSRVQIQFNLGKNITRFSDLPIIGAQTDQMSSGQDRLVCMICQWRVSPLFQK